MSSSSTTSNNNSNGTAFVSDYTRTPAGSRLNHPDSFSSEVSNSSTDSSHPVHKTIFDTISTKLRSRSRSPVNSGNDTTSKYTSSKSQAKAMARRESAQTSTSRKSWDSESPTLTNDNYTAQKMQRQGSDKSDFQKMTYGRHSSDWLFGGFSIRDTIKGASRRGRSSSRSSN